MSDLYLWPQQTGWEREREAVCYFRLLLVVGCLPEAPPLSISPPFRRGYWFALRHAGGVAGGQKRRSDGNVVFIAWLNSRAHLTHGCNVRRNTRAEEPI